MHRFARWTPFLAGLALTTSKAAGQTYYNEASGPELATHAARSAFAASVTIADGRIIVGRPGGVPFFPMPASRAGGLHIFERSGGAWVESASIAPEEGDVEASFGLSVSVAGDLIAVGAPGEGTGTVYVYRGAGDTWTLESRLSWPEGGAASGFGSAIAASANVIVVGAPGHGTGDGAAVAFARNNGDWSQQAVLRSDGGDSGERFGTSVALNGSTLAIGAPGEGIGLIPGTGQPNILPGSVYIMDGSSGSWTLSARLTPEERGPASLGWAVAVGNDEVFASAPLASGFSGAVYRWIPDGSGSWDLSGAVTPDDPAPQSGFGMSMALSGNDMVVGAPLSGGGLGTGYAFARNASTGAWRETAQFGPGGPFSFYGGAVAVGGDAAVVGAPGADFFEGTGFLFRRSADGGWEPDGTIIDEGGGLDPITGGDVECQDGNASGFDCSDVDLVSFVPIQDLGADRGIIANDVWGWTDPLTGVEYAIVGRADATTFVSLRDPSNPVYLGELPLTEGAVPNMWRDMKVYANHVFIVSDGAGPHGVQIFDLTQLRDVANPPATFTETAHYDRIFSAHNIVMNEETGFAYVVGASGGGETCGGGLHMIDVRNPTEPVFAGCFADTRTGNAGTGYSHDAQCINYDGPDEAYQGREICFGANETALSISDVTDKDDPQPISTAQYPNTGYLHQGWVSDDHRYFYMNDEADELAGSVSRTRTLVWDIQELDDPVLVREHFGTTASSDHNLYVRGNLMYQANYVSGLRILDISDPENPEEVGFFDTVPAGENNPGFAGAWSTYPYFNSGVVIVTSMKEGLFVLRKRPTPVS